MKMAYQQNPIVTYEIADEVRMMQDKLLYKLDTLSPYARANVAEPALQTRKQMSPRKVFRLRTPQGWTCETFPTYHTKPKAVPHFWNSTPHENFQSEGKNM